MGVKPLVVIFNSKYLFLFLSSLYMLIGILFLYYSASEQSALVDNYGK